MSASVLYVDDDRSLCQIVDKALSGEGYSVRTCHDGAEAMSVLREMVPDLLLLDIELPRKDGFQLLGEIRSSEGPLSELPVVLLTATSPTPRCEERSNELGARALLAKPVPLEKLLGVVSSALGDGKALALEPVEARDRSSARRRGASGTFDRVSFPALLHHLHGMRATGTLHLADGKRRKWVQIRDGYPVSVRSNLVRETLGRHLMRTRRIDRALLEASLREAEEQGVRHGEVLVAMEVLSDEQIAEVLREQADEKFFELFAWSSGNFRFERNGTLQRASTLGLGRSPANLILEGVRSRFPLERIDAYFESHAKRFVAHGESPFFRFQDVHVEEDVAALLREVDGRQPLRDFQRVEERMRRTVYAFLASGLLELREIASEPKKETGKKAPREKAKATKTKAEPIPSRAPVMEDRVAAKSGSDARRDDPRLAELVELADQLRSDDPRTVLGVSARASTDQVREAYEKLASRLHPDVFKGGSRSLRALAEDGNERVRQAYDALVGSDPREKKRRELAEKNLAREEKERERSERAFRAEVECRQGQEALDARAYETALAHFGKALEMFPDEGDHHAYYGYALHLCHPGDPAMVSEAMEHVKRGLKLASHREKPYLYLGRLHKAVGQAEQAEKMFMRAVQIEPECLEAIRELRLIQMRREKSKGFLGRLLKR